ncbi:MAG: aminoglycoside phosphotransferase family protein [Candidatus Promineofilum sp.]|nr:aminoglycoside phosphotransferase family protein [Promineifilum sp.]
MLPHDFEKERIAHRLLKQDGLYIPTLLAAGAIRDRIEWPYLILDYVRGEAWRDCSQRLRTDEQIAILKELGGIIRVVHATSLPLGAAWPLPGAWQLLVDARLPRVADELRRQTALSSHVVREIEQLLLSTEWSAFQPCLCHADLTEDHLLLRQDAGKWQIAGLIDWADVEVAPPLYDWVTLWFSLCRRRRDLFAAFLAGYEGPQSTEITAGQMVAFTFLHRFGAGILNEVLSLAEQREINNLKGLEQRLFSELLVKPRR